MRTIGTPRPVVVGHDGHTLGPLRTGQVLAEALELPLVLATAYDYEPMTRSAQMVLNDPARHREEHAEDVADRALTLVRRTPEARSVVLAAAGRDRALADLAKAEEASYIVVGPDRRGAVTSSVLAHADRPVVVAPAEALLVTSPAVVGVAYDDSPPSRTALAAATALCEATGATLRILTVADRKPTGHAADVVSHAAARVPAGIALETRVLHGRAATELRRACEHLDVLACGSHGRGRLQRAVLGSVSATLVDDPVCPVVVVPPCVRRHDLGPLA